MKNSTLLLFCLFLCQITFAQIQKVNGINGANVLSLAQKGNKLFAGTTNGIIYVSSDNGANWTRTSIPQPNSNNPCNTLYAIGNRIFAGTGDGVYYSDNDGTNWTHPTNFVNIIGIVASSTKIFAATYSNGLLVSEDGGGTFSNYSDSLISANTSFREIYKNGADIYLTDYSQQGWGTHVFKSSDNGQTWNTIDTAPQDVIEIYQSGSRSFMASYFTLYYSDDNWITRTYFTLPPNYGSSQNLHFYANANSLFCYTQGGLSNSFDNGLTWSILPLHKSVNYLTEIGNTLFAATSGGIFTSTDNGNSWTKSDNGISEILPITNVNMNGTLLQLVENSGVFRSQDGGFNWESVIQNVASEKLTDLTMSEDSTLYLSDKFRIVYKSYDKGTTWLADTINNLNLHSLAYMSGKLFACDFNGNLYKSDTANIDFQPYYSLQFVNCLKTNQNRMFGFSNTGFFVSDDVGITWQKKSTASYISPNALLYFRTKGDKILLNFNNTIYYSADNGNTWANVFSQYFTQGVALENDTFYVGSTDKIYASTDYGSTWTSSAPYFGNYNIYLTPILIQNENLFFAKKHDGIYYNNITTSIENPIFSPEIFVFPNPTHDKLYVSLPTPSDKNAIKMWDINGKYLEIKGIEKGNLFEIEVSHLEKGIYLLGMKGNFAKWVKD